MFPTRSLSGSDPGSPNYTPLSPGQVPQYQTNTYPQPAINIDPPLNADPRTPHLRALAARRWTEVDVPKYLDTRTNPDAETVQNGIKLTQKFIPTMNGLSPRIGSEELTVRLWRADTLQAASMLRIRWPTDRIAVLNHANPTVPGGWLLNGVVAQEEELCMRSTLYQSLGQHLYPMMIPEVIHSPDVLVCKGFDGSWAGCDLAPRERFFVDVISAPAILKPRCIMNQDREMYASHSDRDTMKKGIKSILIAAVHARARRLVIGAWGCGIFGNPVYEVALLFKEEILGIDDAPPETNWAKHGIEEIVIAIYDRDHQHGLPVWNGFLQVFGARREPLPPGVQRLDTSEASYVLRLPLDSTDLHDDGNANDGADLGQGPTDTTHNLNTPSSNRIGGPNKPITISSRSSKPPKIANRQPQQDPIHLYGGPGDQNLNAHLASEAVRLLRNIVSNENNPDQHSHAPETFRNSSSDDPPSVGDVPNQSTADITTPAQPPKQTAGNVLRQGQEREGGYDAQDQSSSLPDYSNV